MPEKEYIQTLVKTIEEALKALDPIKAVALLEALGDFSDERALEFENNQPPLGDEVPEMAYAKAVKAEASQMEFQFLTYSSKRKAK